MLGTEFAGRVSMNTHTPKGCPFKPGDRVFGAAQGAFGEVVAANWKMCLPVPESMSWEQAAGLYM